MVDDRLVTQHLMVHSCTFYVKKWTLDLARPARTHVCHSQKFASFFWSKKVFCQFLLCYRKFGWIRLWISVSRVLHFNFTVHFPWGWKRDISQYLLLYNQHITHTVAAPVFFYILAVVTGLSRYVFNGRCFNWLALGDSFPWSWAFIMKCWKRQWLMWLTACGSIILQNDKL